MEEIMDLDILRPKSRKVKLAGKIIDVSFIPCGVTFEVDALLRELSEINQEKIGNDLEETKKGYNLAIQLCSVFVSAQYPEMNEEWFKKSTTSGQLTEIVNAIRDALAESYKGVEQYGKN